MSCIIHKMTWTEMKSVETINVVCIDHRLEEDLMFWETLARNLATARSRPPMFLVVGSGERAARMLVASGGSFRRTKGVLNPESTAERNGLERASREDGSRSLPKS